MLRKHLGERFTEYNIKMGGTGILAFTIGDVKIVALVGQCPNNFAQDCSSFLHRSEQ